MTDQTSTDGQANTVPTPGTDSVIVPASAVTAPATLTVTPSVEPEKKFIFNLPETLIIVLVVVSLIHFGLKPKHTVPVKVQEPKKVTNVVKVQKGTKTETVAKPSTKSKAQVKAERRHKKNDHTYNGPFGN